MEDLQHISFDRTKNPGIEFDLFPLEEVLELKNLDHNPTRAHRVDFYVMLFITEGRGKHTVDFTDHSYQKGSIITIRKNQIHQFHRSTSKGLLLIFTEEFMVSYLEQKEAEKIVKVFNELLNPQTTHLNATQYEELSTLIQQMEHEFRRALDSHTSSIIRNLLQAFMSKLYRIRVREVQVQNDHKYMQQFLQFQELVEEKCSAHRNVSFYAEQLNVTPRTLNNITQSIVKKSSKSFIDEVLTLQIKRKLINTDSSIKEIAYQSGFDEPTNLFKFFKKFTSHTPEHFRSIHTANS